MLCGCVLLLLGVPVISHAQILKDRGKLKTVKSEGRSFLLFARKIKTESPRKKTVKKRGGRSSASAPLFGSRIKAVSPRYSKRRFIAGRPSAGPRTTPGKKPVKKNIANPRTSNTRGGPIRLAAGPRYTPKPKAGKKSVVTPRFSEGRGSPVRLSDSPRYTARPKRSKKLVIAPRYTEPRSGVVAPYAVRYSEVAKRGKKPKVSPRFSQPGKKNQKIITKPGFSVFDYLLAIPAGVILAVRPHNEQLAEYKGDLKRRDVDRHQNKSRKYTGGARREIKIVRNYRAKRMAKSLMTYNGGYKRRTAFFEKLHNKKRSRLYSDVVVPSGYNKHRKNAQLGSVSPKMVKVKTKTGKEVDKKAGRLRSKLDGNKNQPPSVRRKSRKLKFDKKEKGLWYE